MREIQQKNKIEGRIRTARKEEEKLCPKDKTNIDTGRDRKLQRDSCSDVEMNVNSGGAERYPWQELMRKIYGR